MNLKEASTYFDGVTRFKDNSFQCKCPVHHDHTASMTVSKGKKGILIHCHAGCETKSILEAVGLRESDLFYDSNVTKVKQDWKDRLEHSKKKKIVEIYDYVDQGGKYLYSKIRFEKDENGKKEMLYGVLNKEKDWFQYGLKGKHKTLYNLPEIREAAAQKRTIYYVEGEKDVETLRGLGLIATTAGSSGDWRRFFSMYFSGIDVVLLPDNDEAGEKLTTRIISDLIGVVNSIKVVKTSERDHGDVTDYFQDGYTIEDFNKLVRETEFIPQNQGKDVDKPTKKKAIPQWIKEKVAELGPEINYSYDDRGNGDLFADVFKDVCRFNSTAKCWCCYNGKFWEEDRAELIAAENAKMLQDALLIYATTIEDYKEREEYGKHVMKIGRQQVRKNMIYDARSKYPVKAEQFDQHKELFNCKNGTYNLETGVLQKHNPNDYISKISNVYYDPAAKSTEIQKTMNTILQGNKENIEYIQKIFGMALSGITNEEKLFLLYGATTRNGKSTIVETYLYMIKDYGITMQPETLALSKKDSRTANGDIARLKGARFVNAPEPPQNMRFDAALIKQLTGNDMITARKIYQEEMSFIPEFITLINTNHLPIITDETLFTSGRIVVIPFRKHFEEYEQDKWLKNRLKQRQNISGFFNWCVAGYQKYQKDGLETTESMNQEIESYHMNSDKIAAFISEVLTEDPTQFVTMKELYPIYEQWCYKYNYQPYGKVKFIDYFRRSGQLKNQAKIKGKKYKNVVKGLYINPFEKESGN
jgi:putative DNA primase/helicase